MRFGTQILLACLCGFAFLDGYSVRLAPFEREVYGLVLAVFGLMALLALPRLKLRPAAIIFVVSWLSLALLALIQGLWGNHWELAYLVGDFGVLMTPILLFLACAVGRGDEPALFCHEQALKVLAYGLMAAAALSFFFGRDPLLNGRYIPPNLLLAAWLIAQVLAAKKNRQRWQYLALLMLFGVVAFLSNERTTVVIWAGGVVAMVATFRGRILAVVGGTVAVSAVIAATVVGMMAAGGSSGGDGFQSRFGKIEGGSDDSLQGRFNEVADMLATVDREWGPYDYLIGAGHGATFKPVQSFPPRNVIDGRVHNIHIGPALVFYRYGFFGLFGWAWWLAYLLCSIPRGLSPSCPPHQRMFIFGAGFVFLDSLMRNAFVDPISCFAVAGLFHLYLVQRPTRLSVA
ncbi:MAG: hypothetical protein H8E15_09785 [Planctomycetes bacterium]|nr:hypothetical protein [Planctomycetota bacterium]